MKRLAAFGLAAALVVSIGPAAVAQGGGPSPEMMAKFQAWRKFNENNKNLDRLRKTLMGFREIEKDPKTQFNKQQAREILAVIKQWRNKPALTDDQAKTINRALTKSLTEAQIKLLAAASDPMRGGRGFGGGSRPAGGGPGGMGRPGAGMANPANFPDPRPYNPLNPDTSPFKAVNPEGHKRMVQLLNEFVRKLETTAK
jgi:hypothetical protein